jgi:hypothetical protein
MTELEQVQAAIVRHDAQNAASLADMQRIRLEGVRFDLLKGHRVLKCHCPDCLSEALALREPNPLSCQRALAEAAAERDRKAALTRDIVLDKKK